MRGPARRSQGTIPVNLTAQAKKKLAERIYAEEAELRESLHNLGEPGALATGGRPVDCGVAFAEVFKNGASTSRWRTRPTFARSCSKRPSRSCGAISLLFYVSSADLYVYFFARTHQILRPGGTACVISSNKWLKAGYGEPLRRFFAESAWVASVVDFGHAKQIFQEADVFPSILVFRKPTAKAPPSISHVCAIPRERLRLDDLTRQTAAEGFAVPRDRLNGDAWTLEPPGVVALLEKIRRAGMPLKEYAKASPLLGIKTALNEAFLLDSLTKKSLVSADPKCSEIIKPYIRGQDNRPLGSAMGRLLDDRSQSSGDCDWPWSAAGSRPKRCSRGLSVCSCPPEPIPRRCNQAQDQGRYWWELRSCAFWDRFQKPKIWFQQIQYHPWYAYDRDGLFGNNKTTFVPTDDLYLLAVLNSPLMWWHNFRHLPHM